MQQVLLLFLFLFFCPYSQASDELVVESDESVFAELKKRIKDRTDFIERKANRLGNNTFEISCYLAVPGDFEQFRKIAPEFAAWREWALTDINLAPPSRGDYIFQIHDLQQKDPGIMAAIFSFNIPFFKKQRTRTFEMSSRDSEKVLFIEGKSIPTENSAVKSAKAYMKTFPAENKTGSLWIHVKALVAFKSWILYEALPEKVLQTEVGDRLQYLIQNYQREETRRKQSGQALTLK